MKYAKLEKKKKLLSISTQFLEKFGTFTIMEEFDAMQGVTLKALQTSRSH